MMTKRPCAAARPARNAAPIAALGDRNDPGAGLLGQGNRPIGIFVIGDQYLAADAAAGKERFRFRDAD